MEFLNNNDYFRMIFGFSLFGLAFAGGVLLMIYILASHPADD